MFSVVVQTALLAMTVESRASGESIEEIQWNLGQKAEHRMDTGCCF